MKGIILLAASAALATTFTASAGILKDGSWSASGCGTKPEAPVIDSSSADFASRFCHVKPLCKRPGELMNVDTLWECSVVNRLC